MKSILTTVALVATLALPALAEDNSAHQASQLQTKGVSRAMASGKVGFDKAALLQSKGQWRPYPLSFKTGRTSAVAESLLTIRSVNVMQQKNPLSWGLGGSHDPSKVGNFRLNYSPVAQRSAYFHASRADWRNIRAHVPGIESAVRETLTYHFAWKGGSFGLPVLDTVAKDNWYLRMACTPKLKKETENKYTAQVACFGRLGNSAQQLPVVVQFTLLGSEKNWKIQGAPTVVSANRLVRPGQSVMANVWAEESAPAAAETENAVSNQ